MAGQRNVKVHVNFWAATRDIFTHSMNKGQFPLACFAALVAILVVKVSPEYAERLLDRILSSLTTLKGFSYVANVLLILGWAVYAKWQRSLAHNEMDRIGREKTRLQEERTGRNFKTGQENKDPKK
jgi:hypothetical protein